MARFVETATLKVDDQSSKKIRKINAELKKLNKTSKAVAATFKAINKIQLEAKGAREVTRQLEAVVRAVERIRRVRNASIRVTTAGAAKAISDLRRVRDGTRNRTMVASFKTPGAANLRKTLGLLARAKKTRVLTIRATQTGVRQVTSDVRKLADELARARKNAKIHVTSSFTGQGGAGKKPPTSGVPMVKATPSQPLRLDTGPLKAAFREIGRELGREIRYALIQGTGEGVKKVDILDAQLKSLGIENKDREAFNRRASQLSDQFRGQFGRTDIATVMREIAPSFTNNVDQTTQMAKLLLQFAQQRVNAGATVDQALDGLARLNKAIDATGQKFDTQGKLNVPLIKELIAVFQQRSITGGAEVTPQLIAMIAKRLKTAGQTMTPEGLRAALFFGEDLGQQVGNQFDQLIKQLTGRAAKWAQANQRTAGFIDETSIKDTELGRIGGKKITERRGKVKESELLRRNPTAWFMKYMIPHLEKTLGPQGLDSPSAVADELGKFFSRATAEDMANKIVNNLQEFMRIASLEQGLETSDKKLQDVAAESSFARLQAADSQITQLLGDIATSLETAVIPVLDFVATTAKSVSDLVAGTGTTMDAKNAVVGLTAGGGVGALAAGGVIAGRNFLFGDMRGAAKDLKVAASMLQRAAVAQGGVAGTVPGGKKMSRGRIGAGVAVTAGTIALSGTSLLVESGIIKPESKIGDTAMKAAEGAVTGAIAGMLLGGPKGAAVGAAVGASGPLLSHAAEVKRAAREANLGNRIAELTRQLKALEAMAKTTVNPIAKRQTMLDAEGVRMELKSSKEEYSALGLERIEQFKLDALLGNMAEVTQPIISEFSATGASLSMEISNAGTQAGTAVNQGMTMGGEQAGSLLQQSIFAGALQGAEALKTAVSNVRVSVDTSGVKADTGSNHQL